MLYRNHALYIKRVDDDIVELVFDLQNSPVNKFSQQVIRYLHDGILEIHKSINTIKAIIVKSAKPTFIVGADITEFPSFFQLSEEEILQSEAFTNHTFSSFEDLPVPTVTAINGFALGGGLEMCLASDYRVMSERAAIGFPELKLGLIPGFGGTVRFSRLVGVETAIQWIHKGDHYNGAKGLEVSAVDAVVKPSKLNEIALDFAKRAVAGELDWKRARQRKIAPHMEQSFYFTTVLDQLKTKTLADYPAPFCAVEAIQAHISQDRDRALEIEANYFTQLCKTKTAKNLVGIFLAGQKVKKQIKKIKTTVDYIDTIGIIGAGDVGINVANLALHANKSVILIDSSEEYLASAEQKIRHNLAAQSNQRSKLTLSSNMEDISNSDIVIEALADENLKLSTLLKLEKYVGDTVTITSNTSTLSINKLAEKFKYPNRFCGLHFLLSVPDMKLVEVIRGNKTNDKALSTAILVADSLGNTPMVVNDCVGFFVNRMLYPYLLAFLQLVNEGVSFEHIDQVMKGFGWSMGPGELLDTIGLDIAHSQLTLMAQAYPERMQYDLTTALDILQKKRRIGKKSGKGFYRYEARKDGVIQPVLDSALLRLTTHKEKMLPDSTITSRLMLPLCLEALGCLNELVLKTAEEIDIASLLGIGFPDFRGGPLRYMDDTGHQEILRQLKEFESYGRLYQYDMEIEKRLTLGQLFFLP